HLLVEVAVEMKRLHAHIRPRNTALQQAPEILQSICVYAAIHVLHSVINHLVSVVGRESFIGEQLIRIQRSPSRDVFPHFILEHALSTVGDYGCANLSAALQNSDYSGLVLCTRSRDAALTLADVHIASLAANEGFVNFHFTAELRAKEIILQSQPDSMQHEPCRLLGDFQVACDLIATDAVLAVRQKPCCRQPFIEGNWAVLKNGSHLDGEFAFGMVTRAFP